MLGYGGAAVVGVLEAVGGSVSGELPFVCGLAGLVWTVLVLRAQWRDGRWRRATVLYGIASLLMVFALAPVGSLLGGAGETYYDAAGAVGALMVVWLARSAHDLADPRPQPVAPPPLPVRPRG
ncbi:hypothetical protein HS041_11000 [Planomonospora sp. ID67723]|uniref:hypothetical protein n=1 Tax=Planomonospora sp. ID67723 TaxID=2738134 RepID=UPI0018C417D5|nr:hypothetical protein [Planomonospora sp. ID67723]MBG0828291.1 hypothetical protein [Planomonospora sp. ID67723]